MPNFEKMNSNKAPREGADAEAIEKEKDVKKVIGEMVERLKKLDPDGFPDPETYSSTNEVKD
jgi:hypothetical protein